MSTLHCYYDDDASPNIFCDVCLQISEIKSSPVSLEALKSYVEHASLAFLSENAITYMSICAQVVFNIVIYSIVIYSMTVSYSIWLHLCSH